MHGEIQLYLKTSCIRTTLSGLKIIIYTNVDILQLLQNTFLIRKEYRIHYLLPYSIFRTFLVHGKIRVLIENLEIYLNRQQFPTYYDHIHSVFTKNYKYRKKISSTEGTCSLTFSSVKNDLVQFHLWYAFNGIPMYLMCSLFAF